MTVNLPPWLRRLQQSWWMALIVEPVFVAAVPVIIAMAGPTLADLSMKCIYAGLGAGGVALLLNLQHSFGSATFNPDGTPNRQVAEVVEADAEKQPIAVVPVESKAVVAEIRSAADAGAPIAVGVNSTVVSQATAPAKP